MVHVGVKTGLLVGLEFVGQRGGRDVRHESGQEANGKSRKTHLDGTSSMSALLLLVSSAKWRVNWGSEVEDVHVLDSCVFIGSAGFALFASPQHCQCLFSVLHTSVNSTLHLIFSSCFALYI